MNFSLFVPFDTGVREKLYLFHAKTRLSTQEEKTYTHARIPRADENFRRQERPQAQAGNRKKEAHGLTHAPKAQSTPIL